MILNIKYFIFILAAHGHMILLTTIDKNPCYRLALYIKKYWFSPGQRIKAATDCYIDNYCTMQRMCTDNIQVEHR